MRATCCAAASVLAALIILALFVAVALCSLWRGGVGHAPGPGDRVYFVDATQLVRELSPYTPAIMEYMAAAGRRMDPLRNMSKAQGVKLSHWDGASPSDALEAVKRIIDGTDFPAMCGEALGEASLLMAPCKEEMYCWHLRAYAEEHDFLDWHFDNNFTIGERFTLVVNLHVNAQNSSHFLAVGPTGAIHFYAAEAGSAWVYNGSHIKHAITAQRRGGERLCLIVPLFQTNERSLSGRITQSVRDISFEVLKL